MSHGAGCAALSPYNVSITALVMAGSLRSCARSRLCGDDDEPDQKQADNQPDRGAEVRHRMRRLGHYPRADTKLQGRLRPGLIIVVLEPCSSLVASHCTLSTDRNERL